MNDIDIGTIIELFWPPSEEWQIGTITDSYDDDEYAIKFQNERMYNPVLCIPLLSLIFVTEYIQHLMSHWHTN